VESKNEFLSTEKQINVFVFTFSCGNTAAYCGVAVSYGNCGYTACGAGLCCTRYG